MSKRMLRGRARAARLFDRGEMVNAEAAMAKLVGSENAMANSWAAVQTLGGGGYSQEYLVEKWMRDTNRDRGGHLGHPAAGDLPFSGQGGRSGKAGGPVPHSTCLPPGTARFVNVIAGYAWHAHPGTVHSAAANGGVLAMARTLAVCVFEGRGRLRGFFGVERG
ncbi:acyl-CoA dehydrogenase family protein [Streptomyces atratus]|uniref:acyl-CoA dehydrogenase family protein n=1 Tax=Streptomyces atratus TaxID=1893 RepID=UPI0033FDD8C0